MSDEWQMIETAPKSELHLLLWGGGRVYEGYWGGKNWYSLYDPDMIAKPTHWRHIPKPPRSVTEVLPTAQKSL
jgi:hypothetical protein